MFPVVNLFFFLCDLTFLLHAHAFFFLVRLMRFNCSGFNVLVFGIFSSLTQGFSSELIVFFFFFGIVLDISWNLIDDRFFISSVLIRVKVDLLNNWVFFVFSCKFEFFSVTCVYNYLLLLLIVGVLTVSWASRRNRLNSLVDFSGF